jgi:hypothetical protein
LLPKGQWVSIVGSTENITLEMFSPPRRSILDIAQAIEPSLQITKIEAIYCELTSQTNQPVLHPFWMVTSAKRVLPVAPV